MAHINPAISGADRAAIDSELTMAVFVKRPNYQPRVHTRWDSILESVFDAIAWNLERRPGHASREVIARTIRQSFSHLLAQGVVDHAVLSALIFLRWMNQFYLVSGWNPAYFYYPTVDAAASIYLHNALGYLFTRPPLMFPLLAPSRHPLAYLLYLCDHLQEADRPGFVVGRADEGAELRHLRIDDESLEVGICHRGHLTDSDWPTRTEHELRRAIDLDVLFARFGLRCDAEPT